MVSTKTRHNRLARNFSTLHVIVNEMYCDFRKIRRKCVLLLGNVLTLKLLHVHVFVAL